jgi:hypothetical protein
MYIALRNTSHFDLDEAVDFAVHQITYEIVTPVGDGEEWKVVGHAEAFFMDGDYDSMDVIVHADGFDGDTYEAAELFYSNGGLMEQDEIYSQNLLLVKSIVLDAEVRGQELGLQVFRALVKLHGGSANVVCLPSPLEERDGVEKPDATAKLWAYWSQLGFSDSHDKYLWHRGGHRWAA